MLFSDTPVAPQPYNYATVDEYAAALAAYNTAIIEASIAAAQASSGSAPTTELPAASGQPVEQKGGWIAGGAAALFIFLALKPKGRI